VRSCDDEYMRFPGECVADTVVYAVSGTLAALCVVLVVTVIVVALQKRKIKSDLERCDITN
jgi:hypothetical protein